jgi:hypothetical protein
VSNSFRSLLSAGWLRGITPVRQFASATHFIVGPIGIL